MDSAAAFTFATAGRIVFGSGVSADAGKLARTLGAKALVVTGSNRNRAADVFKSLQDEGIDTLAFSVKGEPTVDDIVEGTRMARQGGCDTVVSVGGGSVIDAGKAVAALMTNDGDPLDYLEVVGQGNNLAHRAAPHIAIPTTSGTGSEVTKNAVLAVPSHQRKCSLRDGGMLPTVALIDPLRTLDCPQRVTADSGLDALTQCLEPIVSRCSNPLTDAIAREGLRRAARSLRQAYECGSDVQAREDMAFASVCGGLALANAKLGAVHGFAGPIGGMFPAPHGAVCAALLPHVFRANVDALRERDPENPALPKFTEVARLLTGVHDATPEDGARFLEELNKSVDVRPLRAFGIQSGDFAEIVSKSSCSSSMKGNPIELTDSELAGILRAAL